MLEMKKIHEDKRGEIYIITGMKEHEEVTLFTTKAGKARGGCIHKKNDEHCIVLEGEIEHFMKWQHDCLPLGKVRGKKGIVITVPANKPHYFVSLTDSLVMEWGATAEEKKEKDPEFRKIVDRINKEAD